MTAEITYPADGRRAWPSSGRGGTLRTDGLVLGRYYRARAATASKDILAIGTAGFRADRDSAVCAIDEYAVWRAALAIQTELRDRSFAGADGKPLSLDGLWGPNVDFAVKSFQRQAGLYTDGVYGPSTSKAFWRPVAERVCTETDPGHNTDLARIMIGTIQLESSWDPGAVGSDPMDLGLGQINGPAHPTLSVNDRLNPKVALPWIARFIDGNLRTFDYDVDLAVAAYNLGRSGATRWRDVGMPDTWTVSGAERDIRGYIDKILNPS